MNSKQLATYIAEELEKLVRADERAARPLRKAERAELVQWLKLEFRRLAKHNGDLHGPVIVDRTRRIVKVRPAPRPHIEHHMSLPACLRTPTTEANLARMHLSHIAYKRLPQNPNLLRAMGRAADEMAVA